MPSCCTLATFSHVCIPSGCADHLLGLKWLAGAWDQRATFVRNVQVCAHLFKLSLFLAMIQIQSPVAIVPPTPTPTHTHYQHRTTSNDDDARILGRCPPEIVDMLPLELLNVYFESQRLLVFF